MRMALAAGSTRMSRRVVAERWAQRDASQRADLVYQAATLGTVVLLLLTAIAF